MLSHTHTHTLVMERSFMAALKSLPTQHSDLHYGKTPLSSSSSSSFTHSSAIQSLLAPSSFQPAAVLFIQLYFIFNTSVFLSPTLSFHLYLPLGAFLSFSNILFSSFLAFFFAPSPRFSSLFLLPQMSVL